MAESLDATKHHITLSLELHFPVKKATWRINYVKKKYKLHIDKNSKPHLKTKKQNLSNIFFLICQEQFSKGISNYPAAFSYTWVRIISAYTNVG